mgnify:CR=1 FL=1
MNTRLPRRAAIAGTAATFAIHSARAAGPEEIRLDWATYNPVSLILKDQGAMEKEFAKDNIKIRWVFSAGSNKALEFLNAGSIDLGSTAGSAALLAKVFGDQPRHGFYHWDAALTLASATPLFTRAEVMAGLRHLAPYGEATLLVTNLRTALILLSVAAVFFVGILVKYILFK